MEIETDLMTVDEVAAYLRCSKSQIYTMCSARTRARMEKPLPRFKLNGSLKFKKSEVDKWLNELSEAGKTYWLTFRGHE